MADQIRGELALLLTREVHDPGIGFVTITRVTVSADIGLARVFYTVLGDEKARANSAKALDRALPFLRRQVGMRLRLKRVPELKFNYDESVAGQDRIERLLNEIHSAERERGPDDVVDPDNPDRDPGKDHGGD